MKAILLAALLKGGMVLGICWLLSVMTGVSLNHPAWVFGVIGVALALDYVTRTPKA